VSPAASGHGKELMASHDIPVRAPPPRTFKPLLAAVMLMGTAAGGFFFSGALVAAPLSPWVTGDSGTITGQVKDDDDNPLANASVAVGSRLAATNGTGHFDLAGITPGRQVIVVDCPGFRQLRFITLVAGGNAVPYSFVLSPGNGTETTNDVPNQTNFFYTCGGLSAVFSAVTLLGGLFSAQRKRYAVAMAGGIVGMGILPLFPLCTIICLGAIVLLLFSRGEFQ
jgi:hypothetical protein